MDFDTANPTKLLDKKYLIMRTPREDAEQCAGNAAYMGVERQWKSDPCEYDMISFAEATECLALCKQYKYDPSEKYSYRYEIMIQVSGFGSEFPDMEKLFPETLDF
jgi:hypothetical protein